MIFALHGNVGSTSDFDFLSKNNDDIKPVDLWSLSHLSIEDAAKQVQEIAKHDRPRGILGYSMGGRLALQSLATEPNFWDYAIIISAHPGLPDEKSRKKRIKQDQEWARMIQEEDWDTFLDKWNSQSVLEGAIPENQSELESKKDRIAAGFKNWSLGLQEDLRPKLRNHPCPIFWIVGENDSKYLELGVEAVSEMPQGLLVKAPDCGHRVLLEAPRSIRSLFEAIR